MALMAIDLDRFRHPRLILFHIIIFRKFVNDVYILC